MAIAWANQWQPVSERQRRYIEGELGWELSHSPQHPLSGTAYRIVAALDFYDNFILRRCESDTYAYVRLTLTAEPPYFEPIGDEEALNRFILTGAAAG